MSWSPYIFNYKLPRNLHTMRRVLLSEVENKKSTRFSKLDKVISSLIINAIISIELGQNKFYITLSKSSFNYVVTTDNCIEKVLFSYKAFLATIKIMEDLGYFKILKGGRTYSFYPPNRIKGESGYVLKEANPSYIEICDKFIALLPHALYDNYYKMANILHIEDQDMEELKIINYPQYFNGGLDRIRKEK